MRMRSVFERLFRAFFVCSCAAKAAFAQSAAVPTIVVARAKAMLTSRIVPVPGELRPFQEVRLYAKVSGFVQDVRVDRGSRVHKGEVVARLEAPELTAQIAEAESRSEAAKSALAEGEARYRASRATFTRIQSAASTDGVISPDEVDRARATMLADSARLSTLQSQLSAAESAHRAIRDMGSYLLVTAPFDGVITERNVHPGALVGPATAGGATPMFRLQDESRLRLTVSLPESYVGSGMMVGSASFQVRAFPTDTFHAMLARRAQALDPQTRSEALEFDVSNLSGRLKAGMYADVFISLTRSSPSVTVPSTAVATSVNGPFVIAVIGDTTHWVRVKKGDTVGDRVEVFGDLHDGERVAVRGTEEIRSGRRVQARTQLDTTQKAATPAKRKP